MDEGFWIIVNLDKGRLGEQSLTFGSLVLTMLKNALFAREKRSLFTVYCDEIQNFVAFHGGIETMLSEARKFGVAIVSANQFLDQYPPEMRAAILAVGTHVFFQLSSGDAGQIAQALDSGRRMSELLKNLPHRHFVLKSGPERAVEAKVPAGLSTARRLHRSPESFSVPVGQGACAHRAGDCETARACRTEAGRTPPWVGISRAD